MRYRAAWWIVSHCFYPWQRASFNVILFEWAMIDKKFPFVSQPTNVPLSKAEMGSGHSKWRSSQVLVACDHVGGTRAQGFSCMWEVHALSPLNSALTGVVPGDLAPPCFALHNFNQLFTYSPRVGGMAWTACLFNCNVLKMTLGNCSHRRFCKISLTLQTEKRKPLLGKWIAFKQTTECLGVGKIKSLLKIFVIPLLCKFYCWKHTHCLHTWHNTHVIKTMDVEGIYVHDQNFIILLEILMCCGRSCVVSCANGFWRRVCVI